MNDKISIVDLGVDLVLVTLELRDTKKMSKKIDLTRWSIFALLDKDFMSKIRLACVFGNLGNEAIVITFDNEAFALGLNGAGSSGVGDMTSSLTPRKIAALSEKSIKDIAFGSGPHILALTSDGEIFTWGHNGYCQLGKLILNLDFKSIVFKNLVPTFY